MIVVELKDGRSVDVTEGIAGITTDDVWLSVIDSKGDELAGFNITEVVFYHLEEEPKNDN